MLILALESSAKAASVALMQDNELLAQYSQCSGLTHSRTLLPMVEDMLKNTDTKLADVDLIAVAHGPGSFTGIRIGVSTVKGLAWASDKKCVGVSTLAAMAWNGAGAPADSLICCAMDARRGQIYNALFRFENGRPAALTPDRAISLAELAEELKNTKNSIFVLGDGAELCYNYLLETGLPAVLAPEEVRMQCAWGVCRAAEGETPRSAAELLPVYLRLSQAERERQARERAKQIPSE